MKTITARQLRNRVAALGLASAGVLIAALATSCASQPAATSSGAAASPAASAASSPPPRAAFAPDPLDLTKTNPVALLKLTGVKPDQGSVNGDWTLDGSGLTASGEFFGPPGSANDGVPADRADGEQVTVYTFSTQQARDAAMASDAAAKPDDGHAVIAGPRFYVALDGMAGGQPFGGIYGPRPAAVAKRLHAALLPGSPR
jgi:hypothetical protein